ncbi:MAG: pyruvate formate lyase family protein [Elusimicrobiota bacterium]
MLSKRFQQFKLEAEKDVGSKQRYDFLLDRAVLLTEGYKLNTAVPFELRRAKALAYLIANTKPRMDESSIIAGYYPHVNGMMIAYPELFGSGVKDINDYVSKKPYKGKQKAQLVDVLEFWTRQAPVSLNTAISDPKIGSYRYNGIFMGSGWCNGHCVPNHEKILKIGYSGVAKEAIAVIKKLKPEAPGFYEHKLFLDGIIDICNAVKVFGENYAAELELRANKCGGTERQRLLILADTCRRVPYYPAESFIDAVQSLWFQHMMITMEDQPNAQSPGRIDQFLYPYFKKDKVDDATATELMTDLFLKYWKPYDVQNTMVGGQRVDGTDAVNELSYITLKVLKDLHMIRPVSVRYHKKTDFGLIEAAADVISDGMGVPMMFNDDIIIPSLLDKGISLEDARDYAIIGCIEVTISGKANPRAVSHLMNLGKCFELAINNGKDMRTGGQLGVETGYLYNCKNSAQLMRIYKQQVEYFAKYAVAMSNTGEKIQASTYPMPILSAMTDDCVSRGVDITKGGARYNYHSTCGIGVPNVADSIAAVDTLCFKTKKLSLRKVYNALKSNYKDTEPVRLLLLNHAPKYGNDIDYVDKYAREVAGHYCDVMSKHRSPTGQYFTHLFSFRWHLDPCGKNCWATPDGRRAGDPLAYSISATQGRDIIGATAVCNSVAKIDHRKSAAGTSFIIELHPSVFDDDGYKKVAALMKTFFDNGGGQLQFNVASADTLKKAQEKPEDYKNLFVRVSGFSSQFVTLDKEMQDHIIARTKHRR